MQRTLGAIHVFDEALDAAGKGEILLLARALVDQGDLDAIIEERQFAQAFGQYVVVVFDIVEGLLAR
jgi:hypothetical protein